MGWLYYTPLVFQLVVGIAFEATPGDEYRLYAMTSGASFILSALGLLYIKTKHKLWAYLAMVGFVLGLPTGLMGLVAVRNEMDKESKREFLKDIEND
ncbi:hypothetical protein [Reinekea thalattae]|uniref:Uncharacterized protein n=1 Tax=Reinekea thalattae TaxID=2593301 RepID=A0A5C8ZC83_9GAMM|nr:hypothetical protein [Reinekea thalattae]TXR54450.1 hypothetical protein FME95_07920 [Reinekea thalattae]